MSENISDGMIQDEPVSPKDQWTDYLDPSPDMTVADLKQYIKHLVVGGITALIALTLMVGVLMVVVIRDRYTGSDVEKARATISEVKDLLAEIESTLGDVQQTVASTNETLVSVDGAVATTYETLASVDETITTTNETLASVDDTVAVANETLAEVQELVDNAIAAVAGIEEKASSLEQRTAEIQLLLEEFKLNLPYPD